MTSVICFNLDQSKILLFDNGLNVGLGMSHALAKGGLTFSSIYAHFNTLKKKALRKHYGKR